MEKPRTGYAQISHPKFVVPLTKAIMMKRNLPPIHSFAEFYSRPIEQCISFLSAYASGQQSSDKDVTTSIWTLTGLMLTNPYVDRGLYVLFLFLTAYLFFLVLATISGLRKLHALPCEHLVPIYR